MTPRNLSPVDRQQQLQSAAENGQADEVADALAAGANMYGDADACPLNSAALRGHLEVIKVFIRHGADINTFNYPHDSVLASAVTSRNPDLVTYLIDQGAIRSDTMALQYAVNPTYYNEVIFKALITNNRMTKAIVQSDFIRKFHTNSTLIGLAASGKILALKNRFVGITDIYFTITSQFCRHSKTNHMQENARICRIETENSFFK